MRRRTHREHADKPASKKHFVAGISALFIALFLVIIFVNEYGSLFPSTHARLGFARFLLVLLAELRLEGALKYTQSVHTTLYQRIILTFHARSLPLRIAQGIGLSLVQE
jgi:hypothetical protein